MPGSRSGRQELRGRDGESRWAVQLSGVKIVGEEEDADTRN